MQNIRQLRQQYEKIKGQSPHTPKKSLTPTYSNQQFSSAKVAPTLTPKRKKICNNCVNKHMADEKSQARQELLDSEKKMRERIEEQLNQKNVKYNQLQMEQRKKNLEYTSFNSEMLQKQKERALSEHQQSQKETDIILKGIQQENALKRQQQQQQQMQRQTYLTDLQNQVEYRGNLAKQEKLQNDRQDKEEGQYWSQMARDQECQTQSRNTQQRQLVNYWKSTKPVSDAKKSDQKVKEEQEQLELILKQNIIGERQQQQSKSQQKEQFKQEIEQQLNQKQQQKRREEQNKQKDLENQIARAKQEERMEQMRKQEKMTYQQQYLKDIDKQIRYKEQMRQEQQWKEQREKFGCSILNAKVGSQSECCDECMMKCNPKILNNIHD